MTFLARLFPNGRQRQRDALRPLYDRVVDAARRPHWYRDGNVPDTVTGRFDMVSTVLALLLVRIEQSGGQEERSVALTEIFIDDMDGAVRELGFGDLGVGKQVGRLVGMLGGRVGALREIATMDDATLDDFARRNLHRGADSTDAALAALRRELRVLAATLAETPVDSLLAGEGGW